MKLKNHLKKILEEKLFLKAEKVSSNLIKSSSGGLRLEFALK
jgi:hypothetical protein